MRGRPKGSRSPDYEAKRGELAEKLAQHALAGDLRRMSLREMTLAAGVSEPTLRHYFQDREGVVKAVLERIGARGKPFWDYVAEVELPLEASVRAYLDLSRAGMEHGGFVRAHAFGLLEGVGHPTPGEAYRKELLDPSIAALERRLAVHVARGEMRPCDTRTAAVFLFAPLLSAVLHQSMLGGSGDESAIDFPAFMDELAATFVRAYRA
jgi:AcrR family transcriptional regulator